MRITLITVASFAALSLFATDDYTWVAGATDWMSPSSYKDSAGNVQTVRPASIDNLFFTSAQTLLVDDDTIDFVASIGNMSMVDGFVLDVNISGDVRFNCKLNGGSSLFTGKLKKRGSGTLRLRNAAASGDYHADIEVEEGILYAPDGIGSYRSVIYGDVTVGENGTLFVSSPGNFQCQRLMGSGVVTNDMSSGPVTQLQPQYVGSEPGVFSGTIGGSILYYAPGHQHITGTNNTMQSIYGSARTYAYNDQRTKGILGFTKLGESGKPSSLGTHGTIQFTGDGPACLLYLGRGEISDKTFVFSPKDSFSTPETFDAGLFGGLTLTGSWTLNTACMTRLVLTGDNVEPCHILGTMSSKTDKGTNYTFYVTKKGTGTWRFSAPDNDLRGPIAIQDGTIQFDSLAERGELCSLGRSTEWWSDWYGLQKTPVDYAFLLGAASSVGTMSSSGTNTQICTSRPFAMTGRGGRISADRNALRLGDFSSGTALGSVIRFAGTNESPVNTAWNITDGKGMLSVVKEGSGTWTLDGNLDFSGDIAVNEGTLIVRNSSSRPFDWFRFTVKETAMAKSCTRYTPGKTETGKLQIREIVLSDAKGARQLVDAPLNTVGTDIQPGEVAWGTKGYLPSSGASSQLLDAAFVPGGGRWMSVSLNAVPELDHEDTWVPILMRMPKDGPEVTSFNFQISWGPDSPGDGANYCGRSPTAYKLEGSYDGVHWIGLCGDDSLQLGSNGWWLGGAENTGVTFTNRAVNGSFNVFGNIGFVSVAAGATLKAEGAAITIPKLRVDALGAGTLEGVTLPSDCVLDVTNLQSNANIELPGTYVGVSGMENAKGWTLSVNGNVSRKYVAVFRDGKLSLVCRGITVSIR